MADRSSAVSSATRVLTWMGRPRRPQWRAASLVRFNVPGTPRVGPVLPASAMAGRFHGALKCSGNRADVVVLLDTGAVEAESQALNSVRLQLGDGVVGQLGSGARGNRNFQA